MAESKCQTYGGDLVSIEDENERRFIYNNLLSWTSWRFYWIGLNDVSQSSNYEWVCSVDEQFCPKKPISFYWWSEGMPQQGSVMN